MESGKNTEAELCARILGWVSVHTQQFTTQRSGGIKSLLGDELECVYEEGVNFATNDPAWTPMSEDDPWRNWPPADDKIVSHHTVLVRPVQSDIYTRSN
jgi:hypothetical protein